MRLIICFLSLALLGACATKPKVDANSVNSTLLQSEIWTLNGRIAFTNPEDKFSAALEWHQTNDTYRLRLSKLIGGTLLMLEKDASQLVTLRFDGKTYHDSDAENLVWRITGWRLPVNDFKYWVAGTLNPLGPMPGNIKRDNNQRLWSFESLNGWQVTYQNYKVFSGIALPHNMTINNNSFQLKLRVSDWDFDE